MINTEFFLGKRQDFSTAHLEFTSYGRTAVIEG